MSKYTRGLLAVILAVVLVLPAAAFAMLPEANARSSTGMDGPEATKVVDHDTSNRWKFWAGGYDGSKVTTQNVGRIWTDKTVQAIDDGKSDFLTTLSAMSSTSDTTSLVSKPLDIVMVLDASGSMDESMGGKGSPKRIDALKNAANHFIDTIAEQNKNVKDASKQHQVAIVKFAGKKRDKVGNDTYYSEGYLYNYSQTMQKLTACSGGDVEGLKGTINSIKPSGATRADNGMELAKGITSEREDAQKVVVFFTDGKPTSRSDFSSTVANNAITAAKAMKDEGATVYTIGIFAGANPSDDPMSRKTSDENKFMHAMSSNYPKATSYTSSKLGDRVAGADYYKSATNAAELDQVFKDISSAITSGKGFPTKVEGNNPTGSGYITFEDELGAFMQVNSFTGAEYNGKTYGAATKSTDGNIDTYTFDGELAHLVITVDRADENNPQRGDIVTVKVPASLIPLRRFTVDESAGTFVVDSTDAISPIRVAYASSVKAIARKNLFTPNNVPGLQDYINKHKDADSNTVSFYANKWTGDDAGDTVASFEPAATNSYYYFQKLTPVYTDAACTKLATEKPSGSKTYWYKDEFMAQNSSGAPYDDSVSIPVKGSELESFEGALVKDVDHWSIKAGTARLAFINQLHTTKERVGGNPTDTARDVINPQWNNTKVVSGATKVNVYLGNNGKINFTLDMTPVTVDTKASFGLTKVLEGRDWTDEDKFEFGLTSEDNAPMPRSTTAFATEGHADISFGEIAYDKPGTYVYKVSEKHAGTTVDGIAYSKNVAEFTVTVTPNAKGKLEASVKKTSGEAEFKNTYTANPAESSVTDQITVTKVLTGHKLQANEFSFELVEGEGEDATVVETVKNDADGKVTFSAIKYTEIGQHIYTLREVKGNAGGITYDKTVYTVVTTITDNDKGQLVATHKLQGAEDVEKIEFKNSYTVTPKDFSVTDQIAATKSLTGRDLKAGEFSFELVEGDKVVATGTNDASGKIAMGAVKYDKAGKHTYTLREAKGAEGNGITYDGKTYTVVTTITDKGDGTLKAEHVLKDAKTAEFKNSYNLTPTESSVTDQVKATKSLTGRDLKDGEFSFELVEGDKVVATGTNDASGNIAMGTVKYTKAGKHTYTLREAKGGTTSKGITYSDAKYTIETTITDNGDGTLHAEHVLKDAKAAEFKNSYSVTPEDSSVTDKIKATKSLTGRDLKAGEFSFELVEGDKVVAKGTNAADGTITMKAITYTEAGTHTYTLREVKVDADNGITYSTAAYTIVTTVTDDGNGKLAVKHELQGAKTATFENSYSVTPESSSVTDQITATKSLTGRDLKAGEFSFELVEGDKVVATGTNDASGKIAMGAVKYDKAGKHTYTLREAKGAEGNGITYDGKTYTVVTTITDNGKGKLEAKHELKDAKTAAFENSYKPNPDEFSVTDKIKATKSLTGRDLKDGEFSFELVEGDKVVATGTNDASGNIAMGTVKYTKAGKHTYTLREAKGGTTSKGITYSDAKYTIETTITDNGDGTLHAEHVLKDATAATFENSYSVTPLETELDFGLSKAIDGRDWTDADEFSFTITAPEGTPLPDPATVTVSKKNADDNGIAAIKYGKIRFTAAGTYKYEIRENAGNAAGMTYDSHVATAEVTVTEDGEGKLTANVTKKENGRFTNTYRTELDYAAAGGLKLSKTLSGRPMTEGQFTFTVTPADEASANALGLHEGANNFQSPAAAEGTVGLINILAGSKVKFTQADAGKTFKYTVAEKNDAKPGYTYDDAERTVTIAIADDGAGTLTATTTISGGSEGTLTTEYKTGAGAVESAVIPFVNSYRASTDNPGGAPAQIVATKTLAGRPLADGEFCFGIAYAGEKDAIEGTWATNVNGQVSFGTLHYTTDMLADLVNAKRAIRTDTDAKLAWTINYTAFEYISPLAAKGITAAKSSFGFKVIVVDNGDGTLTATVDYGGVEPLFENVYGADAVDAALTGTKKLQVAEGLTPADITGKFTFTVTADEAGAPMPERTTVTNDAVGNVDFGKIHFTLEDLNRALGVTDDATDKAEADEADNVDADEAEADADADANADEPGDESEPAAPTAPRSHTFIYTVTESGSAPGVTNDASATRKVSYTVTDDGAGHLSVVRNGDDGAAFTFTNTYSVTPTDSVVTDQVKTVKRLTGRDLAAGEFTFELLEDDVVVANGTNDANGTVTLSPIRYEAPGTHTYTLREACPNALGLYKGVTYDGTTYTVVTTVSDNGDGTLTATHKLEGTTESAGFTNKYHAMPTQVSIGAIKVLEGRELKKDEFSFKLVGEDIESTVTNDADGKINFDKLEYDEPGTYVYTISEVKGDEAGMTYDKSVFTVTVNVVDDGEGNLKANVAFTKGDKSVEGIVFNNTYKKPETPVPTPDPGTPKTVTNIVKTVKGFLPTTGDQQAAALLMAFVIAMAGVGALVWGIRKR